MALNFPGLFPPGRDIQATFDYVDIANATGFITFDGINAVDSTGNNYILIDSSQAAGVTPAIVESLGGAGGMTTHTLVNSNSGTSFDADFDMSPLQLPRTLEGEAVARVSLAGDASGGSAHTNVVCTVILRKWDGSTETDIVTKTSRTDTSLAADTETGWALKMTVPKTNFKQGEQIRLTVQIATGNTVSFYAVGHNPNDDALTIAGTSNLSSGNSRLSVSLPFKLPL